jgi:putative transposase
MDGRGRWLDNVFIERLWRSLKYECVYLHAFETESELQAGLKAWIGLYNARRPHSALAGGTPDEAYGTARPLPACGQATIREAHDDERGISLTGPLGCPNGRDNLISPPSD